MNNYRTTDIILAACLRLEGFPMASIELTGTKGTFVFDDIDYSFVDSYDLGQCRVEPISFNNMIKQLTTSVKRMTQR